LHLLISNDDGILARGINLLADVCRAVGDVSVVAPDREQSGASHSLTLQRPLRPVRRQDGSYQVDGTPTDCVLLALGALVGLNQALKDTQQSTKAPSCSPRSCIVIGSDCNCPTGNQVEGGSCGSTANGVLYGGACSLPALPCQSTLSCNNGICDDVRCPVGASALTKP